MRAEEFLQKYRVLEDALEQKYSGRGLKHTSVVMEYLADKESEPVREELDMMREMRNVLSHNADRDGGMVFEPSEAVLRAMDDILDYARRPPRAVDFATPVGKLLCTSPREAALPLMRAMEKRGFSNVPVLEGGRLTGVFSVRTVFSRMVKNPEFDIRPDTLVSDFQMYLPIQAHRGEKFLFMPLEASLSEARQAFMEYPAPNKRLAAIFLTEKGGEDEKLLAMLTPWDALGTGEGGKEAKA